MKKLIVALHKILAGDVLPFKKPEKLEKPERPIKPVKKSNKPTPKQTLIIDWKDAELYPVGGTAMKILAVSLKGVGTGKRIMVSFIPYKKDSISVQLDEVGGAFGRTLKQVPTAQIEQYIKSELLKDIEQAYPTPVKVTQKVSSDLSKIIESIC